MHPVIDRLRHLAFGLCLALTAGLALAQGSSYEDSLSSARLGDTRQLAALLARGIDPDTVDAQGNSLLILADQLGENPDGNLTGRQVEFAKTIHASGRDLLALINDILDLSKIEAGRMELMPSSFNPALALSNAMTLVRERAQQHGIALELLVDPALGEITADERKFKQILVNLLSNAVKFTPDGGRIDVSARRERDHAVIAVRDTGIGIAEQDQAAAFEEFRQVGRDYTNKHEGTGLGLALTRKFIELHGGRIWLDSAPGRGSTFTFTIPLSQ